MLGTGFSLKKKNFVPDASNFGGEDHAIEGGDHDNNGVDPTKPGLGVHQTQT